MNPIAKAYYLVRYLGPSWVWFRARYAFRRKTGGLVRASPKATWNQFTGSISSEPVFFRTPPATIGSECIAEAEAILCGRFRFFSFHEVSAGFPPDWRRNWTAELEIRGQRSEVRGQTADDGDQRSEIRRQTSERRGHGFETDKGNRGSSDLRLPTSAVSEADLRLPTSDLSVTDHRSPPSTVHRSSPSTDLRHWSQYGDFTNGDIKCVWELSRFGWAFTLGRAYAKSGDERYAEGFWMLLEDWMDRNPPNQGRNWMCGQETTFRLMAATFARQVCADAPSTTPARVTRFQQLVVASGSRISANIDYALSQSNNHGMSECIGLITAALLAPNERQSPEWKRRGFEALEKQLAELVYPDGGFAQHSATYHRVILQDLLWIVGLLRQAGETIPNWLMEAGRRATSFLAAIMTLETGHVPLYGANDGANILPLADADYLDFRPVVQAGAVVFFGERWFPAGAWDEMAGWMGGEAGNRWTVDSGRLIGEEGARRPLPVSGHNSLATDHRFPPTTDHRFSPSTDHRPPITDHQSQYTKPAQEVTEGTEKAEGGRQLLDESSRLLGRTTGNQTSEVRDQKSEVRDRKATTPNEGPNAVVRPPTSDIRPLITDDRLPSTDHRSSPPTNNQSPITDHHARRYFSDSGILVWKNDDARAFFRCPTRFKHRPSQADLLHVDVEWRGVRIAHDAGTYSYNTAGVFAGGLKEAAVHNTVTFDGREPMQKVGRFLYLPWPKGRVSCSPADLSAVLPSIGSATEGVSAKVEGSAEVDDRREPDPIRHKTDNPSFHKEGYVEPGQGVECFTATHDGWRKLGIQHRRTLCAAKGAFIVEDEINCTGEHMARVHWLLGDWPHRFEPEKNRISLDTSRGQFRLSWELPMGDDSRRGRNGTSVATVVRADPSSSRGWWSPYYFHAAPALSLVIQIPFSGTAKVRTIFSPL